MGMRFWYLSSVMMLALVGCAQSQRTSAVEDWRMKPPPQRSARPRMVDLGASVQGATIFMHVYGSGPRPVLIMAGIHGDERSTVYVAQQFMRYLDEHPDAFARTSVAVMPVA